MTPAHSLTLTVESRTPVHTYVRACVRTCMRVDRPIDGLDGGWTRSHLSSLDFRRVGQCVISRNPVPTDLPLPVVCSYQYCVVS